ncbi:Tenascin-X [Orchesella cincta]|uniref:Tenascin-X n=1 Tax=Orchesella cincta TaxID=48709 RepID=A0A1D2MHQ3_ORCCI|nr:Tenascin-X [Orchesella cincta]
MKILSWKLFIFLSFFITFTYGYGNTLIGGSCNNPADCVGDPGVTSECREGRCICRPGYFASIGKDDCLLLATGLGESCKEAPQCQKGTPGELSDCIDNICSCINGTSVPNENQETCLEVINEVLGKECEVTLQCTAGLPGAFSECVEELSEPPSGKKKCNCIADAVHSENKCYLKAVAVGGECEIDVQCTEGLGSLSKCEGKENKFCVCPVATSVPSGKNDSCLAITNKIGDSCSENIQCTTGKPRNLSECSSEGVCSCTIDSVNGVNLHVCHKKAQFVGDSCKIPRQCSVSLGERSKCNGKGECSCKPGNVASSDNKRCVVNGIHIGQPCENTAKCVGEPGTSECASKSCECVPGYIPSVGLDDCLKKVNETGGECWETKQCQQGDLGEFSNCFPKSIGVSVCNCTENAITEPDQKQVCRKKAVHVGDPCEFESQCYSSLGNSQCLGDKCVCLDTSTPSTNNTACLLKSSLNKACEDNNQCNWNQESPNSASCQLKNASDTSVGRVCLCRKNEFIESIDHPGNCLKILNETRLSCEEKVQCSAGLGNSSDCVDNFCMCNQNHVYFDGACYYPVVLEGICNSREECIVGVNNYTFCDTGRRCRCLPGASRYEDKCFVPKYVGDACGSNKECTFSISGPVYCQPSTGRCTCQMGFSGAFENTMCSGAIRRVASPTGLLALIFIAWLMSKPT